MDRNQLKELNSETHDHIIRWTENCDTKASILIAFLGIIMSIFFTSDYILETLQSLISPIILYISEGEGVFDLLSSMTFLFLGLTLFFIG